MSITRLTRGGAYKYAGHSTRLGVAVFSAKLDLCYFGDLTLKKIKGGRRGGNYEGVEDGDVYRVSRYECLGGA